MKKLLVTSTVAAVFLFMVSPVVYAAQTQTITLTPSADASIEEGVSNNSGGESTLLCSTIDGYFSFLVKFDLGALPSGTNIVGASFSLTQTAASGEEATLSLYKVTSAWSEASVSGESAPSYDSGVTYGTLPVDVTIGVKTVSQDLSGLVQQWLGNPSLNNGLYFKAPKGTEYSHTFGSKENASKPQLSITYTISDSTAPAISDINVSNISATSVTISWKASELSSGFVDYGTKTTYGKVAGSGDFKDVHTVTLPDLEPETTYHFRIRAIDEDGNEAKASDQTFTTTTDAETEDDEIEEETVSVLPPKDVKAVALRENGKDFVHISWEHGQDERSGYRIYRSVDDSLGYTLLVELESGATEYKDEDVETGKTYFYMVRTVAGGEESNDSDEALVTIFANELERTLSNFSFWKGFVIINVIVLPVFGILYLRYRKLKGKHSKAKGRK